MNTLSVSRHVCGHYCVRSSAEKNRRLIKHLHFVCYELLLKLEKRITDFEWDPQIVKLAGIVSVATAHCLLATVTDRGLDQTDDDLAGIFQRFELARGELGKPAAQCSPPPTIFSDGCRFRAVRALG